MKKNELEKKRRACFERVGRMKPVGDSRIRSIDALNELAHLFDVGFYNDLGFQTLSDFFAHLRASTHIDESWFRKTMRVRGCVAICGVNSDNLVDVNPMWIFDVLPAMSAANVHSMLQDARRLTRKRDFIAKWRR